MSAFRITNIRRFHSWARDSGYPWRQNDGGRRRGIDLPRPRSRGTLALPRFAALRERVWSTLSSEARQAEFQLGE
jgi:hypothetical protein